MKYDKPRKTRKVSTSLRKQQVRVPEDYPWHILTALNKCAAQLNVNVDTDELNRIIRARDISKYSDFTTSHSLQSISCEACTTPHNVEWQMLLGSLMKKYQFSGDRNSRKAAAINIVLEGEKQCSEFNCTGWKRIDMRDKANQYAREFCSRVLGSSLPEFSQLTDRSRHGPGASTGTSFDRKSAYYKYSDWPYDVTARCETHAKQLILSDERWITALTESYITKYPEAPIPVVGTKAETEFWSRVLNIVSGNRITTVPKDVQKDRPIAVEPGLNMMLQLGVDGFVRKRLKRWGVDLDSQIKNQELAQLGSIDGSGLSPCTIDLSSASDTISLRAVKLLVPEPWFDYLCQIRSPKGVLPDKQVLRYSKISSMGNGATFAIESLIFASLCYGVSKAYGDGWQRELTAIYGDDIIVPRYLVHDVLYYLRMWGFSINREKTFVEGPIKESCGADWFRGRLVRPVFLKEKPHHVSDLLSDRNRIFRWLHQRDLGNFCSELDAMYRRWIPERFHNLLGPISDEEFDTYWHVDIPTSQKWEDGVYRYRKLTCNLGTKNWDALDFGFRKLMTAIHPRGEPTHGYPNVKVNRGSVFDVLDERKVRRSVSGGTAYNWAESYKSLYTCPAKAEPI